MKYRPEKVNSLIKEEIGKILLREMEFPGMLVTVIEVKTSDDMKKAAVGVSVLPASKEKDALKILGKGANYLSRLLDDKIRLRPTPRVHFAIDRGSEKAARVEELLRKG